jgi:hypothetical protein
MATNINFNTSIIKQKIENIIGLYYFQHKSEIALVGDFMEMKSIPIMKRTGSSSLI